MSRWKMCSLSLDLLEPARLFNLILEDEKLNFMLGAHFKFVNLLSLNNLKNCFIF